jgi:single-stranded-DNA-specific exonuclease
MQRPQTVPFEASGIRITSDERNPFVAKRRASSNSPRVSVLACRALWDLSEGHISVRYLPANRYPKICIQIKPQGISIANGRRAGQVDIETILLDVEDGRVNSTGAIQSPAAAAVFAALDIYDRRRGIDFAPAYLAFLRAKSSGNSLRTRDALLAATDELLVSMLNDYQTDRIPPAIRWHNAPKDSEFRRMLGSKVIEVGPFVTDAQVLSLHRPEMDPYIARRSVVFATPVMSSPAEEDLDDTFEDSDHSGMGITEPVPALTPAPFAAPVPVPGLSTLPENVIAEQLSSELKVSKVAAAMLVARGFTEAGAAREYIHPHGLESHDPYEMRGMFAAAARLHRAVSGKERIVIYGDYDADGITGTSILLIYLRSVGANVTPVIPMRNSGYGLTAIAAEQLRQEHDPDLVITVDCGSSDHEAVAYLVGEGVDVLVTDHHLTLQGPPPTPYYLNPNRNDGDPYPFHGLCGCGVAYKLLQAIAVPAEGETYAHIPELYDLLMISTVADQVPLVDENRFYVQAGLARVNSRSRGNLGLWSLADQSGVFLENLDAVALGWKIAPHINAVSRMDLDPTLGVELLTTSDHDRAMELAKQCHHANGDRKTLTDRLYEQALAQLGDNPPGDILGVLLPESPVGVAGMVAAKIVERYLRPVLVVNNEGRGSGRAPDGQEILSYMEQLTGMGIFGTPRRRADGTSVTPGFGGHSAACGFYDVDIESFLAAVSSLRNPAGTAGGAKARIDARIGLAEVTLELADELAKMGPYGLGNPEPVFEIRDLEILEPKQSKSGHSLLFSLTDGSYVVRAHWFGGGKVPIADLPARVDVLASPVRDWTKAVSLSVTTVRPSRTQPPKREPVKVPDDQVFLVIATRKQSGKSTAAKILAKLTGAREIGTSIIINEIVEKEHDLASGTIARARIDNPEAYRPELIATGNRMDDEGQTVGVVALTRGYRIVEGIRRTDELRKAIDYTRAHTGRAPFVICLENPDASVPADNTEAEGLRALADVVIPNNPKSGTLDELEGRIYEALSAVRVN